MTRTILSLIVCTGVGASVSSLAAPPPNADPALATWFRSLKTPNGTATPAMNLNNSPAMWGDIEARDPAFAKVYLAEKRAALAVL